MAKRSGPTTSTTTTTEPRGDPAPGLILGSADDPAIAVVRNALAAAGHPAHFVDPSILDYELAVDARDGVLLRTDSWESVITSTTRIWRRRSSWPTAGSFVSLAEPTREFAASALSALWGSAYAQSAEWMNPRQPRFGLESDKVTQAITADRVGLLTIPTLFTTSEAAFRSFVDRVDGDVAIKSPISWHAEIEGERDPYGTYTRRLGRREALGMSSRIGGAALLVQPYVEKEYELRITIVAGEVFTCRIDSQASEVSSTDWRHYDLSHVKHHAWTVPADISTKLISLMSEWHLLFACIDMIVEPSGRHRLVELNPSGQYAWIEALTGLPITQSITSWLLGERR